MSRLFEGHIHLRISFIALQSILILRYLLNFAPGSAPVEVIQALCRISLINALGNIHFILMSHLVGENTSQVHQTGFLLDVPKTAFIQVESDNIQMTSFLERFKKFIAQSHGSGSSAINSENNTAVEKFVQHNDTFQANYDFSQNLLTIRSSYNLLYNKTGEKISDVKISINFRFDQDPNRKIVIEDFHGQDAEPRIGIDNITSKESLKEEEREEEDYQIKSNILRTILSQIVNVFEPIAVTFFHIVINGILGHVLTTAFEELYHGRLLSR